MGLEVALIGCATLLLSAWLTGLARRYAVSHGLIDVPNERSSHDVPTSRGGGVAIVLATSAAFIALTILGLMRVRLLVAVAPSGLLVAAVGLMDDRRRLSAGLRFLVHVTAAAWALFWLRGLPPLAFGQHTIALGLAGSVLGVLAIVWILNLFNFMDGIDGIAASEATFVAWGGALLTFAVAGSVAPAAAVFGAACVGFLRWNWPPARIFMGDVGSGYLGYVIAVLALAAARENPVALWVWLILGGVFFVDATVTLLRRMLRGERVHEAHRSHGYQWLARRWGSHGKATLAALAVNLVWLLPCAMSAAAYPGYSALLVIVALAPLAVLAVAIGSGRAEVITAA